MSDQIWQVVATTAQRFHLAALLLNPAVKSKSIQDDRRMYRARKALGLIGITEKLLAGKVRSALVERPRSHVFTVTAENADFLLQAREKVEIFPGPAHSLLALLEQLAKPGQPLPEGADAWPAWDEIEELPQWDPPKETDPPPDADA